MRELLTAAQMRAIEEAAIASGEVTGLELMERAGRGVVEAIFAEWPELAAGGGAAPTPPEYLGQDEKHRAVVLCGPGNNGGDGFVVARLLKETGWEVEVFLYGDPEKLPPDARVNYERWREMGEVEQLGFSLMPRWSFEFAAEAADEIGRCGIVVDALFGIGLKRDVGALHAIVTRYAPASRDWRVVAVDIPSGLCSASGRVLQSDRARDGVCMSAHLTVTFHAAKIGHHLSEGPRLCGELRVASIGLTPIGRPQTSSREPLLLPDVYPVDLAEPALAIRKPPGQKYTHGHALILSGPPGRGGAARLAARGALRIGAGLVTVGCPPEAVAENAARLDAIMLRPVGDATALRDILEDGRINALCLGPGLGTDRQARDLVAVALGDEASPPSTLRGGKARGGERRSLVLDADALTILSRDPDLFAALHERCVLTPHAGEFARLFPDIAEKLAAPATKGPAYSKVDATREAAARAGCVVLFKGSDTVIADPSGRCSVSSAAYDRAAPWLATAGSGDVLAGMITGLLARGFHAMSAACTAAWLHVECALSFGPGLIAEDLPEELPKVFRKLGL